MVSAQRHPTAQAVSVADMLPESMHRFQALHIQAKSVSPLIDLCVAFQTRSAISNQQKNQQEKAALQDSLATKREEARVLLEEKTTALKRIDELEKQLSEGQVSCAVHAEPELPAVHAFARCIWFIRNACFACCG